MLISLIPLVGAGAYLASGTLRRSGLTRLLIDQVAYKMPFKLYRRLGLARLTAARQEQVRAGLLEDGVASYKPVPEAVRVGADN